MITEFEISLGTNKVVETVGGGRVVIIPKNPFAKMPGPISIHEAAHAVTAEDKGSHAELVSIVPGPGYLGRTNLNEFNGVASMAPHAIGCSGTGQDMAVVEMMGYNPNSLAAEAKEVVDDNWDEIYGVGSLLEARGTIFRNEVLWAIDQVRNPEVELGVINPLGEERHFAIKARRGEWIAVPIMITNPSEEQSKQDDSPAHQFTYRIHICLN